MSLSRATIGMSLLAGSAFDMVWTAGADAGEAPGETPGETPNAVLSPSNPDELARVLREAPVDKHTVIMLGAGEWRLNETLEVRTPVTIRGAREGVTSLVLDTDEHYVPALKITSSGTEIDSLHIRHRSPSVANNYCVYLLNAGHVTLRGLDISSETGTGVAIEGGAGKINIIDCHIHGNKNNGIGLFPDVLSGGEEGEDWEDWEEGSSRDGAQRLEVVVSGTVIDRNGKEAIVGRGLGAGVEVRISPSNGLISGGVNFTNCEVVVT